jgi:hypothetical protein
MPKAIGPTFQGELLVATPPVTNWDFSWDVNGNFYWGLSMSQADKNPVNTVYANHDPVKSNLLDYSETVRYNTEIGGITVAGTYTQTDLDSQQALQAVYTYCQIHPSTTIKWKLPDFTFVTYSAAQISNLFDKVNLFVQNCFNTEASVNAGIKAATITTNAQIDAAYATIPTSY